MGSVLALVSPVAVTLTVFFVLYNNVSAGKLILLLLILINLAIILAPTKIRRFAAIEPARPVALWLLVAIVTILGIELAFPICLPLRYAEIRDLTKQWTGDTAQVETEGAILFTNADQRMRRTEPEKTDTVARFKRWHSAGGEFAYYGYDPNSRLRYVNLFHWNSKGYFDHDYENTKAEGVTRIVVIGDSYVEAVQVPLARTFHKLLESELNNGAVSSTPRKYEVVALGSAGTGQEHNLDVVRKEGLSFFPDMVVFTLCGNDFCDDDPELKKELVLASGTVTPVIRGLCGHGYYAAGFVLRRIEDLRRNRIGVSPELLQWAKDDIPRVEAAWNRSLEYVREAQDFCRQRGIAFMLVYLGSDLEVKYALDPSRTIARLKAMGGPHENIGWDMEKSVRRVTTFCNENNIPLISMLDPLIAAQRETGNQVFGDHYTLFGHQVAAQVLRCALDHSPGKLRGEHVSFKDCMSPDAWGPVAPVAVVAAPGQPSEATFVPASSPGPQNRKPQ